MNEATGESAAPAVEQNCVPLHPLPRRVDGCGILRVRVDSTRLVGDRLWRIRKRQHVIDAIVRPAAREAVALEYVLNGRRIYVREWPTREAAETTAGARLRDLQRAGWATHW
ncbi:MAG: hypothetical protein ACRECI_12410 [Methyloceanibacter sp.]